MLHTFRPHSCDCIRRLSGRRVRKNTAKNRLLQIKRLFTAELRGADPCPPVR